MLHSTIPTQVANYDTVLRLGSWLFVIKGSRFPRKHRTFCIRDDETNISNVISITFKQSRYGAALKALLDWHAVRIWSRAVSGATS